MNDDWDVAGHIPVLRNEVLRQMAPAPGATVVDATVGLGGHASDLAGKLGPSGRLIAVDRDPHSLDVARERVVGCEVHWVHDSFANLSRILRELGVEKVDGVLADLGVSSPQLDVAERGFSFRRDGPLDMRMDPGKGEPASNLVNRLSAQRLAQIFREFGEERFSRQIASRIVRERANEPVTTTGRLAELVRAVVPKSKRGSGIDPATRVFQALRIAVNDELGALDALLEQLPRFVRPGGRAVIISFHSLEDRRVKRSFQNQRFWKALTRKPVAADEESIRENPRARSAKLRAAERIEEV